MNDCVTVNETLTFLNEALVRDPDWVNRLFDFRPNCNVSIANHPTIQAMEGTASAYAEVLGLLNGLFGVDENHYGPISAWVEDGVITEFQRTKEGGRGT